MDKMKHKMTKLFSRLETIIVFWLKIHESWKIDADIMQAICVLPFDYITLNVWHKPDTCAFSFNLALNRCYTGLHWTMQLHILASYVLILLYITIKWRERIKKVLKYRTGFSLKIFNNFSITSCLILCLGQQWHQM